MAQTAKEYAQSQLGNLDLSYLDNERNAAQNTYNTSKSSLENNFNNLLEQISNNRADTRKNFNTGRATVAENSYNTNRTNQADLASRGVGNSGLKGLGEVGNRMETGKQFSNLANQFYGDMDKLDTTETQGHSQYDIDQQNIRNVLNQTLSGVDTHGAEARNQYNMTLGQLAESVQGRWDANANAKAQLAQQESLAAQARAQAQSAAKQQLKTMNEQDLQKIITSGRSEKDMIAAITSRFGVDNDFATRLLQELGLSPIKYFKFSINEPHTPTNYLEQLRGRW